MKKSVKVTALLLTLVMVVVFAACGAKTNDATVTDGDKVFRVGVIQLLEHDALNANYQGFVDKLNELMPGQVEIDYQNAQGEQTNCTTIVNKFVSDDVDMIFAIATPAAQAAKAATSDIPILISSVTDPKEAALVDSNEVPGGNLTGTSDLNPIEQQSDLLLQLVPDAKTVGVFYNSGEDNSIFQYNLAKAALEAKGIEVQAYTVSDATQLETVAQSSVGKIDAAYIGTDNLIASSMGTISKVLTEAGIPIICGEENMVVNGGTATYGLNYYNLGVKTAEMAYDVLVNGADTATMAIQYLPAEELDFSVNKEILAQLNIELPAELEAQLAD
ncbi:MAG: ABC transporter substrate-binding protein [Clostridia bacterium]|nr:ABC transporter substrate-binding protein [Clostridia bacterium]